MKKYNIGIITLNGYKNFGNRLQNLALSKIYENKNCNVKTIWDFNFKECLKNTIKNFLILNKKYSRFRKFYSFSNKYIKKSYNLKKFEMIILGSDQVWNPIDSINRKSLLGIGISQKKISYAASFGIDTIPKKYYSLYKKGLSSLDLVSVREKKGIKIYSEITKKNDAKILLDPTLMLNKEEWKKYEIKPKKMDNEKYILVYFLGNLSEEISEKIKNLAALKNYKIINILDKKSDYYNIGPGEFLYLENNAELICTDSFHSCVFALIFNKPFVVFDRIDNSGDMSSRIDTFLETFNLKNRKYFNNSKLSSYLKFDYNQSYKILEKEKNKSYDYISKSLDLLKRE